MSCIKNDGYTSEEKVTAFRKSERKEYGLVTSVDITPRFLKEYLQAELLVKNAPIEGEENRRIWEERVRPFFEHMNEMLDTL